jgi:hypothetical protein
VVQTAGGPAAPSGAAAPLFRQDPFVVGPVSVQIFPGGRLVPALFLKELFLFLLKVKHHVGGGCFGVGQAGGWRYTQDGRGLIVMRPVLLEDEMTRKFERSTVHLLQFLGNLHESIHNESFVP